MMNENSLAIALYGNDGDPIKKALAIGDMFSQSGLFGVANVAQGHVLALECITRNLPPGILLERYHIVDGRLSLRADYMLSEFKRRNGKDSVIWIKTGSKSSGYVAEATFKIGDASVTESYSFEEAKESGICYTKNRELKSNWKSSTPDMVRARLVSKTIRFLDPGINSGMYTPEEVSDFTEKEVDIDLSKPSKSEVFAETSVKRPESTVKPDKSNSIEAEVVETKEALKKAPIEENNETLPSNLPEEPSEGAFSGEYSELFQLLSEKEEAVNEFLRAKAWISKDQTFLDTPENWLKMMKDRPSDFINAAEKEFSQNK